MVIIERFCKTKMCTNFCNFGRKTWREREMNFRRKFREMGSWYTCTWRVQTTKMRRTQSSCENSYTVSQGLSRNFVRIFVAQKLSNVTKRNDGNLRSILADKMWRNVHSLNNGLTCAEEDKNYNGEAGSQNSTSFLTNSFCLQSPPPPPPPYGEEINQNLNSTRSEYGAHYLWSPTS